MQCTRIHSHRLKNLFHHSAKDEQEKIWDMTRYDDLISDLTLKENLSDDEINNILINYPEEMRKTAMERHKKNYNILVRW